jgi:acetate---CoA ligase (ADP-forming)
MELGRLLSPRSIAVVGASERPASYGGEALLNLRRVGYEGRVYAVNPGRAWVHGVPCVARLDDLPEAPDAVVVAIPAADAPEVVDAAGALGCGGAVVFAAGFGEATGGAALQARLVAAASRHGLPVCGPNGNGIASPAERVALWGDAVERLDPGAVALVTQSGNLAVNALGSRRGLRLHTVVSCGNGAVLDAAAFAEALAARPGVRSLALYLEDDGDGEGWCAALEACARAGVGVAVLKAGSSAAGASAALAHTGALAGDQRVVRALFTEAGAAWTRSPHELLEVAKALAVPGARRGGSGVAVMTCSGGDSSLAADAAEELGVPLPAPAPDTLARLQATLPPAARAANPLDYTSLLWEDGDALCELVLALADDPGAGQVLVLYDEAVTGDGAAAASWGGVLDAVLRAAGTAPVPVSVGSTLPELLGDATAKRLQDAGMPAVAGLRTALAAVAALGASVADPVRIADIGAAAGRAAAGAPARWYSEQEAKALLRAAGLPVVPGRIARDAQDAVAAATELGGPVALKRCAPGVRHKSEHGGVLLGLSAPAAIRAGFTRLREGGEVLVEAMAPAGAELLVAARADAIAPVLAVGAGGIWAEALDDVALVPLPASPARVERALRGLRAAPLLTGGRSREAVDLAAIARVACGVGALLLEHGLALVECNPVFAHPGGAVIADALAAAPVPARPTSQEPAP